MVAPKFVLNFVKICIYEAPGISTDTAGKFSPKFSQDKGVKKVPKEGRFGLRATALFPLLNDRSLELWGVRTNQFFKQKSYLLPSAGEKKQYFL